MPFTFENLDIDGLVVVRPRRFEDERGWFTESYKRSAFTEIGIPDFVQDNVSQSATGVLRGLHLQLHPYAQGKLVSVVRGRAWDVAVDLRPSSPTYRKWHSIELSEKNQIMFYIPPGFAHGFLALENDTLLRYKCSAEYNGASERGVRYDDPNISISWPVASPLLSERDAMLPALSALEPELSR